MRYEAQMWKILQSDCRQVGLNPKSLLIKKQSGMITHWASRPVTYCTKAWRLSSLVRLPAYFGEGDEAEAFRTTLFALTFPPIFLSDILYINITYLLTSCLCCVLTKEQL